MKKSIIFIILIILLSGCLGVEKENPIRTYIYNYTDENYINHTITLKLYSNDTFSYHSLNHWCNCGPIDSGHYTETEESISIKFLTDSVFIKNGYDLIDKDGNTWRGLR
jgi:hypothetical protein